jgi:hypothetical protein
MSYNRIATTIFCGSQNPDFTHRARMNTVKYAVDLSFFRTVDQVVVLDLNRAIYLNTPRPFFIRALWQIMGCVNGVAIGIPNLFSCCDELHFAMETVY